MCSLTTMTLSLTPCKPREYTRFFLLKNSTKHFSSVMSACLDLNASKQMMKPICFQRNFQSCGLPGSFESMSLIADRTTSLSLSKAFTNSVLCQRLIPFLDKTKQSSLRLSQVTEEILWSKWVWTSWSHEIKMTSLSAPGNSKTFSSLTKIKTYVSFQMWRVRRVSYVV